MKGKRIVSSVVVVGLLVGLVAGVSLAQGVPVGTAFTYQGRLMDASGPVSGTCDLTFGLYDEAGTGSPPAGGTLLDSQTLDDVPLSDGYLTAALDFGPQAFQGEARWLEIAVDCGGGAATLSPRQPLTPAPYALWAAAAGGAPWEGLTGVPQGLADGLDDDALAALSCAGGEVPQWDGAAWVCALAGGATYSAGTGLGLLDTQFSIAPTYRLPQTCTDEQVAAWNGTTWACGNDDDTTYHAGRGLVLSGTQFRLAGSYQLPQGCVGGQIPGWDGTAWACQADDDALGSLSCAEGEVAEWDGSAWACATDDEAGHAAGNQLVLVGTTFHVVEGTGSGLDADLLDGLEGAGYQARVDGTCPLGSSIRAVEEDGAVVCEPDDDTTYRAGRGLVLFGTQFRLSGTYQLPQTCADGEIAEWDGGAWACAADDEAGHTAGNQLSLEGTTFHVEEGPGSGLDADLLDGLEGAGYQARVTGTCPAGSSIRTVEENGAVVCEPDDDTTYDAGRGLVLSGTQFRLSATYQLPQTCADGEIAAWNGTAWVCEADDDALASLSCADGQVPEWDNTNQKWVCAEDNDSGGDITTVTAGTGLSGGGTSGDVTVSANTTYLQRRVDATCTAGSSIRVVNANGTVACEVDDDALGGLSCANGKIAKRVGGAWACADDNTGAVGSFWSLTGNLGTTAGTNFLGTTDDEPLELHVEGARALRLEPASSPNVIGGYSGNTVAADKVGATVGGGGSSTGCMSDPCPNEVGGNYGTVGGGRNNAASGDSATVGGGQGNAASGSLATVGGGAGNQASAAYATIGGGGGGGLPPVLRCEPSMLIACPNRVTDNHGTVGGGAQNVAGNSDADTTNAHFASVGGGSGNHASGGFATVGGGRYNQAAARYATIAGGGPSDENDAANTNNRVTDDYGAIGGGGNNQAGIPGALSAPYATVGGGQSNTASDSHATVGGGGNNQAGDPGDLSAPYATVGGGQGNTASGSRATVGGGDSNTSFGCDATVGGGNGNQANGQYSTVAGGQGNTTAAGGCVGGGLIVRDGPTHSTIGGGESNTASGSRATVGGGQANTATGAHATVGGGESNATTVAHATVGGGKSNTASGVASTVGGGQANTATGAHATVGGGESNTASAKYATVPGGASADASHYGQMSYASGSFANPGDAQAGLYVLRAETTEQTRDRRLYLDGLSEELTIATGRTMAFDILVVARSEDSSSAGYTIQGVVEYDTTPLGKEGVMFVGTPTVTTLGENVSGWSVDVDIDIDSDILYIELDYGPSDGRIRWVATVRTSEVAW